MTLPQPVNSSSSVETSTPLAIESRRPPLPIIEKIESIVQRMLESNSSSPLSHLMFEFSMVIKVDSPFLSLLTQWILLKDQSRSDSIDCHVNHVRQNLDQIILSKLNRGDQLKLFNLDQDGFNLFLLRSGHKIKTIDISGYLFSSRFLELMPNLSLFKISGCRPCELTFYQSLLEALGNLSHLEDVSLPSNGIEDEIGWLIPPFTKSGGPLRLNLSCNRLAEDEVELIDELFGVCKRLTSLNFSYNLFGNQGAETMSMSLEFPETLEEFFFAGNDLIIDDEGFSTGVLAITKICSETPSLRLIDLYDNQLALKDFEVVINDLKWLPNLQELRLSLIRDETNLITLPSKLKELQKLTGIVLSFDRIDAQETASLMEAFNEKIPALKVKIN